MVLGAVADQVCDTPHCTACHPAYYFSVLHVVLHIVLPEILPSTYVLHVVLHVILRMVLLRIRYVICTAVALYCILYYMPSCLLLHCPALYCCRATHCTILHGTAMPCCPCPDLLP